MNNFMNVTINPLMRIKLLHEYTVKRVHRKIDKSECVKNHIAYIG